MKYCPGLEFWWSSQAPSLSHLLVGFNENFHLFSHFPLSLSSSLLWPSFTESSFLLNHDTSSCLPSSYSSRWFFRVIKRRKTSVCPWSSRIERGMQTWNGKWTRVDSGKNFFPMRNSTWKARRLVLPFLFPCLSSLLSYSLNRLQVSFAPFSFIFFIIFTRSIISPCRNKRHRVWSSSENLFQHFVNTRRVSHLSFFFTHFYNRNI